VKTIFQKYSQDSEYLRILRLRRVYTLSEEDEDSAETVKSIARELFPFITFTLSRVSTN